MEIIGRYQVQFSSKQEDARLKIDDGRYTLYVDNDDILSGEISQLNVSDRLGKTLRKVRKGDEWVFITRDNRVDQIVLSPTHTQSRMHKMERSWSWVFGGVVVIALLTYSFIVWGLPYASEKIAYSLPLETNKVIAKDALKAMDEYMLSKSSLSKQRQKEIVEHFDKKIKPFINEEHLDIKLHFRDWKMGGESIANAFALPSGDVVLTDRFVNMTKNNDELDAVLLHEIGHVVHRDTLKSIIQSTFISTAVAMATGDASGFGDVASGLGSMMLQSKYSREIESAADVYAFDKMLVIGIDPHSFSVIINRISGGSPMEMNKQKKIKKDNNKSKAESSGEGMMSYFSSHPYTKNRMKIADAYSMCFKEKKVTCEVNIEEIANEQK